MSVRRCPLSPPERWARSHVIVSDGQCVFCKKSFVRTRKGTLRRMGERDTAVRALAR